MDGGLATRALALLVLTGCSDPTPGEPDAGYVCEANSDCDDGIFCNGAEQCDPVSPTAAPSGCMPGSDPCAAGQSCVETTMGCVPDPECDQDEDGALARSCGGDDCDDTDPARHPGNPEVCDADGVDEDCDATTLGTDADADGYYALTCCNGDRCGADCNDDLEGVNPGASDGCGAGDEDCDGSIDEEGDTPFYRDLDGDGFGDAESIVLGCGSPPTGFTAVAGDCDDDPSDDPADGPSAATVFPEAAEGCDGVDNDCDDAIDETAPEDSFECCTTAGELCETVGLVCNSPGACSASLCGDFIIDPRTAEECDDGNVNDGDGCDSTCQSE